MEEVQLPIYEERLGSPYTHYKPIKYPKPGTSNPTVELHVVDLPNIDGNNADNRNTNGQSSYVLQPPTIIRQRYTCSKLDARSLTLII